MAISKARFDKTWVGLICGIIGPWIGYLTFYLITSSHLTLQAFTKMIINNSGTHSGMISVSLIFNLVFFFIAMRKDWYQAGRGVIMATFIYAPFVVFFKYG